MASVFHLTRWLKMNVTTKNSNSQMRTYHCVKTAISPLTDNQPWFIWTDFEVLTSLLTQGFSSAAVFLSQGLAGLTQTYHLQQHPLERVLYMLIAEWIRRIEVSIQSQSSVPWHTLRAFTKWVWTFFVLSYDKMACLWNDTISGYGKVTFYHISCVTIT